MDWNLNERALAVVEGLLPAAEQLRVQSHSVPGGGRLIDCGVNVSGGLGAGLALAQVCTAGLAEVSMIPGDIGGIGCPYVQVATDNPVAACLLSQYAGWQIAVEKFFGMGSGPMRAVAAREDLFEKLDYREQPSQCVGVLEADQLPDEKVFAFIAERTNLAAEQITLLVAPTASIAGNFQVVARVVETALHKLLELGFDMSRIVSGYGTAPLSPVAGDFLAGIGRTNDAILYGGRVTLWVTGDDDSLSTIGPQVPSVSSQAYGQPFLEIFEAAGRDFYQIDPHLFSPAEILFQNVETGNVQRFGNVAPDILSRSFGF
ncbi:Methenyltetrahydromethanopterin cyclohydrolase [Symmachiella dynata]|uniref:methenyltetrahydromethanopterin cyclohydrolase n=1 Tax=Symmachiella dynata TaxID=2527995 RepID=UPI001189A6D7|nr:methenyltetrahydromethanopterin cyclohydrolase [Symmachiella dynata]QDT47804.1 Methenyltetrahydromethanopterin cyclohydrolase [Symmachiella dynata]